MRLFKKTYILSLAIFLGSAATTYFIQIQGFNILDDGLWLLGARVIDQGGCLYKDFFSIYGPLKYYLLLPFFGVFGSSVQTLVIFKAITTGAASLFGFLATRRCGAGRLSLIVPVAVFALGAIPVRYVFAIAFAALLSEMLTTNLPTIWKGIVLGVAWGVLSLFGLDMMIYGMIIIIVGSLFAKRINETKVFFQKRDFWGVLIGISFVSGVVFLVAFAMGTLEVYLWDTILCPLTNTPSHIGPSSLDGLFRTPKFGPVFSQIFTGEDIGQVWSGHAWHRLFSIRLMIILVFGAPILATIFRRQIGNPRVGPMVALALSGWITILWRNDVAHLIPAFYGTIILLICPLDTVRIKKVPVVLISLVLLLIVLGPFAGQNIWLLTHYDRAGLKTWERATARVKVSKGRLEVLETLLEALEDDSNQPLIAWPAHPGLLFLSEKPLATSQVTLLAGGVRDPRSVIDELRLTTPHQLIIGRVAGLTPRARTMQVLSPLIWTYLRTHFFIEKQLSDGAEGFQIIRSLDSIGGIKQKIPIERQLPGPVQLVKNATTPPLSSTTKIGQVIEVGGIDLHGITLLVATRGVLPARFKMELTIEKLDSAGPAHVLGLFESDVYLTQEVQNCSFVFAPIPGSAGEKVAVSFSGEAEGKQEMRLLWHDPREDDISSCDYYPEGYALIDGNGPSNRIYL